MNHRMPDFIMPRDERELCELFDDLLFMRTEKFGVSNEKSDSAFKPNDHDIRVLCETGATGRIFRRWFQTTWGSNSWSTFFKGETPRQELWYRYADIRNGDALLFAEMKERNNRKGWHTVPHLFLKKDIPEDGGVFTSRLKKMSSRKKASTPSFDIGFKKFAEQMYAVEKIAQSLPSYNPPKDEEEKWWRLFWRQVGASLSFNIYLELPEEQLLKTAIEIQKCLDSSARQQGSDICNYINVDNLFAYLWEILKSNDKRLVSYSEMIDRNEERMSARMIEPDYLYSTKVFFYLGHMFDEKILFPIDMYFGGVECVWTDHQSFFEALMNMVNLLKNDLSVSIDYTGVSTEEKRQSEYMDVGDIVFDIERLWFAPPTVFRLLPRVTRYF